MGERLQAVLRRISERDIDDRAATLAATLAVGQSFAPSLLPRKPAQQAVLTGLSAVVLYGVSRASQAIIDTITERLVPGGDVQSVSNRRVLGVVANGVALGAGVAAQRALARRRGEPVKRAAARTAAWQIAAAGGLGLTIAGLQAGVDLTVGRTGKVPSSLIPAGFLLGAGVASAEIVWYRRRAPHPPPLVSSIGQGVAVMTGVSVLAALERRVAAGVSGWVRRATPGFAGLADPIGHLSALAPLGLVMWLGLEAVYRRTELGGSAVEHAYQSPPSAPTVSGGPHSAVDWQTLGREGRRFVNMVMPAAEISEVTRAPAQDPVRVFVGLGTAASVDARVSIAMDELESLGAFERSVLCLASPTGTGYVNYVVAETLEYLTGGDCATISLQYSLRPSFLSLDRVHLGREQNRALLHAINGRLRAIPPAQRPKYVAVGESLGAFTLQDAFLHEGTAGLHRAGISRALFIGTPAESKWAEQWRLDPERADPEHEVVEVASYSEWLELPAELRDSARFILLSHHDDPITKFRPALAVQAPDWMSDGTSRSPALIEGVRWRPITSFMLTTVDVLNASDVVPGRFAARGHDYRADLGRFTQIAFDLPGDGALMGRVERALRRREVTWAERRVVAEQLAQAKESISRQLKSWATVDEPSGNPATLQP